MAQIDNLIGMMTQRKVEKALLVNDKPMNLYVGGQSMPGSPISGAQLQTVLQEVTPPHLREKLAMDGGFHFPYQNSHGEFDIAVGRNAGTLQVTITPSSGVSNGNGNGNGAVTPPPTPTITPEDASANGTATAENPFGAGGDIKSRGEAASKDIEHIDQLFRLMKQLDASDLHLSADETPIMRIQGKIIRLDEYKVQSDAMLRKVMFPIAPQRNQEEYENGGDTDFAYEIDGVARFRCNFFADRKGIGGVFRLIPSQVLTVEQLGLGKVILELCYLSKGLVVVTGPTGSGKSTTLAAMIDFINKNRDDHIITIEDPVEFVHQNIKCLINQREVHVHTDSFKRALRAALREDPDIVLVGEMRDLETIAIAIETAETGHLVFGTLHTTTAPSTVDRIIDQFPSDQQAQIRVMLSESLKGVIAQTLLRTVDGKRVAAHEILLVPGAVANLIREGKTFQLPSQMQMGKGIGMVTMNDSILEYVKSGRVSPHEGYVKAVDKMGLLGSYEALGLDYDPGTVRAE